MRLTLCYVSFAVFLVERAQAAPMLGLPSLPLVGQSSQLVDGIAQTGLPIAGQVGGLTSEHFNSPSLGSISNILHITSALAGGGRSAQGSSPLTGLVGTLPVSGLLSSLKKREPQRDVLGLGNLLGSIPLLGRILVPGPSSTGSTSLLGSLLGSGYSPSTTRTTANPSATSGLPSSVPMIGNAGGNNLLSAPPIADSQQLGSKATTPSLGDLSSWFPSY